jgi:hypothetical protein
MKKQLTISALVFASLIGGVVARAESTLNPFENLKKIEANAAKEKARQEAYEKATTYKPTAPKSNTGGTKSTGRSQAK